MELRTYLSWKSAAILLLLSGAVHAQYEVSAQDEYGKRLKAYDSIRTTGNSPFGEQINLYTGMVTFQQADITLEGMGPTISLVRTTASSVDDTQIVHPHAMGSWTLSIPRIETIVHNTFRWTVPGDTEAERLARCTRFDQPIGTYFVNGQGWHGFDLITETGDRQPILQRDLFNFNQPTMTASSGGQMAFPALTNSNWQVGCLSSTLNSTGEGFFVVAPNGTKYWFNYLKTDAANTIFESTIGGTIKYRRSLATMYATRIEDRFGNYIVYDYGNDDKLDTITASDGRSVSLTWRSDAYRLVESIKVQPAHAQARTWTYEYGDFTAYTAGVQTYRSATLTGVVLPDGSRWDFNLAAGTGGGSSPQYNVDCGIRTHANGTATSASTITHPSGLVGTFHFQDTWHGQSYVPSSCRYPTQPGEEFEPYEERPPIFGTSSLVRRDISGPGMATKSWFYSYEPAQGSTTSDPCAANGTCHFTKWVNVVDAAGDLTTYVYLNRFGVTDGQMLHMATYEGTSGNPVRRQIYAFATSNEGPWPALLGNAMTENAARSNVWMPLKRKEIQQQGKTFIWEALEFDSYANPTKVKRYSNLDASFSRTEETAYLYNTTLWVMGQARKLTDITIPASPVAIQETVFDPNTALPLASYSFGRLKQSFTYYAEGVLQTVKDALNHVYSFSSYKRGIAQRIDFPDTTYITADVDDFGQIAAVRDQLNNTSNYGFDAMGRLASITPPAGWTGSSIAFVRVSGTEYGIETNHWRRTLTKGNARSITYYDAELRPQLTLDYDTANPEGTSRFVAFGYDAFGRQAFVSYPASTAPVWTISGWMLGGAAMPGTRTTYDALGRPLQSVNNTELPGTDALATTTYAYPDGWLSVQVTDPRQATTTTWFQAFDTPSTDNPVLVQMPLGVTSTLVRDRFGKTITITRSGPSTTPVTRAYYYDSAQRLCRLAEPETGNTLTAYDDADNVSWSASGLMISGVGCGYEQVGATQKIVRAYDVMNRVEGIDYPPGTDDIAYTYDDAGNVATATNAANITWTYGARNSLGLPTSETLNVDGFAYTLGYVYTPMGHLSTLTYPDSRAVDFAPNALGQATKAGTFVTGVVFFSDGDVKSYQYGNGISYLAQKNARGLPENLTYSNASNLLYSQDLGYDPNANLASATDLSPSAPSRTKAMKYDLLNRLTESVGPSLWGTELYTYDALDNIMSITRDGVYNEFQYDTLNRLTRIANAANGQTLHSYAYDVRGNATTRDGRTLTFDEANRLLAVSGQGSYKYDAWARRVKRSNGAGAGQSYYVYTQAGQLLFEHNLTSNKLTDYVLLAGKLVAKVEADAPIPSVQAPALNTTGSYTVSWTAVSGATGYRLEQSANNDGWIEIYSGVGLSWNASGKAQGTYSYRAKACFVYGCGNASPATTVNVDLRPQAAPTISAPTYDTDGKYTVNWTAVAAATSYEVQISESSGVWGAFYNASGTSKTVLSQPAGQYNYRGRACNTNGCGPWSATVTTNVELPPSSSPSLSGPGQSFTGSYSISWGAMSGVTNYVLEQSANGGAWTQVQNTAALSWSVSGQPAGSYAYRASACNPAGCSGYSGIVTVTVTYPPVSAASLSLPSSSTSGSFTVSWTAVATASYYNLQRNINSGSWASAYSGGALATDQVLGSDAAFGYQVQGCNVAGCGPWSSIATIAIELTPAMPSSLYVVETPIEDTRPPNFDWYVSWTTSPGAQSYELQVQRNTLSPTVTNLGLATDYYTSGPGTRAFWVRACKSAGNCSAWRDVTSWTYQ